MPDSKQSHWMLQRKTYEECPACRGSGEVLHVLIGGVRRERAPCPVCKPIRVIETGLTVGQIEMMRAKADRVDILEKALAESVKLQSHYAELLNGWDGGKRTGFKDSEAWIARLAEVDSHKSGAP